MIDPNIAPIAKKRIKPPTSGRQKGQTNKVHPAHLLADFQLQSGMTFEQFVNKQIVTAYAEKNNELVARYILGLSKYFISDIVKVDVTSNGHTMGVQVVILPAETGDTYE
jgi:hypothetical protein